MEKVMIEGETVNREDAANAFLSVIHNSKQKLSINAKKDLREECRVIAVFLYCSGFHPVWEEKWYTRLTMTMICGWCYTRISFWYH
jgi:hypothetical protein